MGRERRIQLEPTACGPRRPLQPLTRPGRRPPRTASVLERAGRRRAAVPRRLRRPVLDTRAGAVQRLALLLAWPDQNGAVWCALSQDAAQHWSQPAPVPARTLRGVAFAGWDTVDAYAAWAVAPDGDYSIFWADTTGSTVWRHPHTGHLLQHGQGRLDERASLREPAMAAHGHMWR